MNGYHQKRLTWDDIKDIQGISRRTKELIEDAEFLRSWGVDWEEVLERTGSTLEATVRRYYRAGIPIDDDLAALRTRQRGVAA